MKLKRNKGAGEGEGKSSAHGNACGSLYCFQLFFPRPEVAWLGARLSYVNVVPQTASLGEPQLCLIMPVEKGVIGGNIRGEKCTKKNEKRRNAKNV